MEAECAVCGEKIFLSVIRMAHEGVLGLELTPRKCPKCGHNKWKVTIDMEDPR